MNEHKQNSGKGCLIALRSWWPNKRGQSAIEFASLMVFILAAFFVIQKYAARGLMGRWKGVGDGLGQERIYDPNKTLECEYHPTLKKWYDRVCFDGCRNSPPCNGGPPVPPAAFKGVLMDISNCVPCADSCTSACDQS